MAKVALGVTTTTGPVVAPVGTVVVLSEPETTWNDAATTPTPWWASSLRELGRSKNAVGQSYVGLFLYFSAKMSRGEDGLSSPVEAKTTRAECPNVKSVWPDQSWPHRMACRIFSHLGMAFASPPESLTKTTASLV